jgi:hypothetical protein
MTPTRFRVIVLGLALCLAVGLGLSAANASAQPSSTTTADPIPALLVEVHALRLALEQSAAVTPRVQLTLARLKIEEQRITQLAAQLDRARQELMQAHLLSQKWSEDVVDVEKRLQTEGNDKERKGLEIGLSDLKSRLKTQIASEEQIRNRENDAMQALNTEQSRWIELNSRLDELERLLAPVPR